MTTAHDRYDNGLQAERTTLAWTRTSIAFLGNGALLMLKNLQGSNALMSLIPASLAAAVALCTFLIAMRRQRILGHRPLPTRITPRRPVYLVGTGVLLLILVAAVTQPAYGRTL